MPKSKRNRVVNLTKVKKKGKEWKEGLIAHVRQAVEEFPTLYLFRYFNMRTEQFKELRQELGQTSRFIMGSNKMLQVALGKSESDELRTNLSVIASRLKGHVGLFFTKLPREEVVRTFEAFGVEDFARAGSKAVHDFRLQAGPLNGPHGPLPHTIEPHLRKCNLPTRLNKGVVELLADHEVCREGAVLDPHQVAILRVFNIKMATFRLKLLAVWQDDDVEELAEDDDEEEGGMGDAAFDLLPDADIGDVEVIDD